MKTRTSASSRAPDGPFKLPRMAVGLCVLGLVGFFALACFLRSTEPKASGERTVLGLQTETVIERDEFFVPHIKANNLHDAYFALGYAHASDRLFQLEMTRHAISGRLAEWLGPDFVDEDESLRKLGFLNFGTRFVATHRLDSKIQAAFDAYLDGLNAFVATGPIPLELYLMPYQREPFTMQESLAIVAYMGFGFAEAFIADPLKSEVIEKVGADKAERLWSGRRAAQASTASGGRVQTAALDGKKNESAAGSLAALSGFAERVLNVLPPPFSGSNGWVIAGNRSATGHPLLANDPHIMFTQPNVWWEARISAPGLELHGHFLSLLPFAPLGTTPTHAWGLTMFENDDMDFYAEMVTDDVTLCNGERMPLQKRQEVIAVKGGGSQIVTVKETCHGPIIDESQIDRPLALKWAMYDTNNDPASTFGSLHEAASLESFQASLKTMLSPGLNVIYGDTKGHIAHFPVGALPHRKDGSRIMDGSKAEDDWQGMVPSSMWPATIDPSEGLVVTANDPPGENGVIASDRGPYEVHGHYQSPIRIRRLRELLQAQRVHDESSTALIQNDHYAVLGAQLRDLLRHNKAAEGCKDDAARHAFMTWNGDAAIDTTGGTIATELKRQVLRGLLEDEIGEAHTTKFMNVAIADHALDRLLSDPNNEWWDNVLTATKKETAVDIVAAAFARTCDVLGSELGSYSESAWRWGQVHTLTQTHPFALGSRLMGMWFNVGPHPQPGTNEAVNNMLAPRSGKGFAIAAGPSTRRFVSLVPDRVTSFSVLPAGQSGHAMSAHYADQADLFGEGRYRPGLLVGGDKQQTGSAPVHTLRLHP